MLTLSHVPHLPLLIQHPLVRHWPRHRFCTAAPLLPRLRQGEELQGQGRRGRGWGLGGLAVSKSRFSPE